MTPRIDEQDDAPPPRFDGLRIATLAVLVLVLLSSVGQAVYLSGYVQSQRTVNDCYQNLIDDLITSNGAAREAAKQDRASIREFLVTIAAPGGDDAATMDRYLSALDEADRTRSGTPPPTQRCQR